MDLRLTRKLFRDDGIFSELTTEAGLLLAETLEHAYEYDTHWLPKIPNGRFLCVRGEHRLHGMQETFETFEITGVEGHSNLLFHWGNYNKDSEGCVLVGERLIPRIHEGMITNSKQTFERLMERQRGVQEFWLTVVG